MRRRGAVVALMIGVVLLLVSYVLYTQRVVAELRREASRVGEMFAKVYRVASDPSVDAASALLELQADLRSAGVPVIVTDAAGAPTAIANLPFESADDPRAREWIPRLDAQNAPVVVRSFGTVQTIHFGHTPLVRGLQVVPALQVVTLAMLLLAGAYVLRTRANADRERVWAGMARESAHQLGTPLSSMSGWVELLGEHAGDSMTANAVRHMAADLERLERVSHRFERIGRPPNKVELDVAQVLDRVADYFRARVPTLAHAVAIRTKHAEPLVIQGDPVLIEWAVEALVKNAVDALAGRGGRILIEGSRRPEGEVRLKVWDDGPGIPRDLRRRIFEAGFSTKQHGWGIGLALAKRIVEDWHGGTLTLVPSEKGAAFEIRFPG